MEQKHQSKEVSELELAPEVPFTDFVIALVLGVGLFLFPIFMAIFIYKNRK